MKTHIFDTPHETARALTHQLEKQINTIRRNDFNLAISGGSSSEVLFRLWAEMYAKDLPWYRIHLYWVDERCVPPTNGDSNYGLAKRLFLDKVKIPRTQIHRLIGEANPENESRRYSDIVKKNLPHNGDYPQFDFIILGIGSDGHTSSIFPGQNELLTHPEPYAPSINPHNGQKRIALTGEPILRSTMTVFYVIGAEKAGILTKITASEADSAVYPAGYIFHRANNLHLFADKGAGKNYE